MKAMTFIDFQNFHINFQEYYKKNPSLKIPKITYPKLSENLFNNVKLHNNATLVKTYLFAYKPCDELMEIDHYKSFYKWISGLKNRPYMEVIEGRQEIRAVNKSVKIDLKNANTFTTEEKGTDINIAVQMLSKAYTNAYDIAILVSGDTDYIPVVEQLHNLGKIVVLATLPHQNVNKYNGLYDQHIKISDKILQKCVADTEEK